MDNDDPFKLNNKAFFIFNFIIVFLTISFSVEARLYKWTDENGQVRYGDKIPLKYQKNKFQKLDSEGRIIHTEKKKLDPEVLKEQRIKAEAQAKIDNEIKKKRLEQQKLDRILLLTFHSEDEIFHSRDQKLIVIDSKISLLNKNKASAQKKLLDLDNQAYEQYLSKNLKVPGSLQQKIEHMEKSILSFHQNINQSLKKREEVTTQSEKDLKRFKELQQLKSTK